MEVRNCRMCGRMFNYLSGKPICEGCKADLEKKFQEVKDFVRMNGDAPVNKVAEECEVSVKQIKQWIREERLMLSEEAGFFLECENCGAAVRTGRFCEKCKSKLQNELQRAYVAPKAIVEPTKKGSDKNRMRFLDL